MEKPEYEILFAELVPEEFERANLSDVVSERVHRYFATDICERVIELERRVMKSSDPEAESILQAIRGNVELRDAAIDEELRERAQSYADGLEEDDSRQVLAKTLLNLLLDADWRAISFGSFELTMLACPRWGGPFVDDVREKQRRWFEARARWWLQKGIRCNPMSSAYLPEMRPPVGADSSIDSGLVGP